MRTLFTLIILVFSLTCFSQEYVFEHITTNNGLSNNLVRDIIQDNDGYLWFATSGGLNRYDGRFFDIYRRTLGDTTGLSHSGLKSLFQDNNGYVWVIGSLGDIHRINPLKKAVINLQENNTLPKSAIVKSYQITKSGDIWLLLNKGLMRIYYTNESKTEFNYDNFNEIEQLKDKTVNFIFSDSKNLVWIGTDKGVVRITINEANKQISKYESFYTKENISFISAVQLNDELYFGTASKKVILYNYKNDSFNPDEKINAVLRGNVTCIQYNKEELMLMGTNTGDIIVFDPKTKKTESLRRNNNSDFDANYISEIFADSYGIFWLITEKRGIYQFNPENRKITYFDLNSKDRVFLGENDKQCLLEDSNGNLWVGINGGGLFLYQRGKNRFKQFKHDYKNFSSISSDVVLSLYEDRSKNLWIGTSYGGVNKISLRKENLSLITPVPRPNTEFDNYIRSVAIDDHDGIWVGSKAGKIYRYEDKRITGTIPDDLFEHMNIPMMNVYSLYFDRAGNLWIGTKGNGIFVIKSLLNYSHDLGNSNIKILHFVNNPNDPNSLSSNDVYSITEDIFGRYWIGSFLGGLNLLSNPFGNFEFKHFNASDSDENSLISDEVRYLFFDKDHNLWIGTSEGVSILESKHLVADKKTFINLKPSLLDLNGISGKVVYQIKQTKNDDIFLALLDGSVNQLKAADFEKRNFKWIHYNNQVLSPNVYSIEEDKNGNLWLGTDIGLYRMIVEDGLVDRYRINNNFLPLKFSESCSQKSSQDLLVFGNNNGFVCFHPDSIKKDTTQFPLKFSRLEINGEHITNLNSPLLSTSIEAQERLKLNHSQNNLTLYFTVLGFNNSNVIQYSYILDGYDGTWSKPSTLGYASYRKLQPGKYVLRVKATNSNGVWMNQIISLPVEITPQFWKSKPGYFLIILFTLGLAALIFVLLKKQISIQNSAKVEKAITEKRIEYYTNISHEFKTPLSLILNPVEELISSNKSSEFARHKGMQIKKNAVYLKRLIDQILDFRKIRAGQMQLKVSEINIFDFLREIYLVFLPLANKMKIVFDYECKNENIKGYVDVKQLEKITYNLLSNAFRFTPAEKAVKLSLKINSTSQQIELCVEDEGEGIGEKELPKIFDRFYNNKFSSGIGLFFIREIVMLHHGEIDAFNNVRGGASFRVRIPVAKEVYTKEEIDDNSVNQISFNLQPVDEIATIVSNSSMIYNVHRHNVDYLQTLLVVDDNDVMRNYLCSELSNKYKIIEANDGLKVMELVKQNLPSLILCDANMNGISGFELTQMIKENFDTSHIPVILLSGDSSDEKRLMGARCGADEFIIKPFDLNYLQTRIEKIILDRKKIRDRYERDSKIQDGLNENISREMVFINTVQDIIKQNLSNPNLNVDFLVDKFGISRTLFFKRMKSAKGYAPNEFIRIVRMKEAAALITSTERSITEIGSMVGYSDSNYFSKTFKKHFGKTPSEFKNEKNRNNSI